MNKVARILTLAVTAAAIGACMSSNAPGRKTASGPSGSACIGRGEACSFSRDCCTQWCVNGVCGLQSP